MTEEFKPIDEWDEVRRDGSIVHVRRYAPVEGPREIQLRWRVCDPRGECLWTRLATWGSERSGWLEEVERGE
jgi:hypothetical protein